MLWATWLTFVYFMDILFSWVMLPILPILSSVHTFMHFSLKQLARVVYYTNEYRLFCGFDSLMLYQFKDRLCQCFWT
ncbi:hypothetical protein AAFF_G00363050 [Aldrovandia affinis]|uniref:Uncharacterized protein n=1 Tax=Aldrovandia affinis TaxID=143900 RepID=A0AAD7R4W6_9TELE|nr:hypothetical protein AAFF_G00363050 [Aldrovandia affinis]